MRAVRPSFPVASALALLAVAPAIALGSQGSNSSPGGSGSGDTTTKTVTNGVTKTATTVTGVVGNGANGVVAAPGQGLLPDNAVVIVKPKKDDSTPTDAAAPTDDAPADGTVPVVGERLAVTPEGTVRVKAPGGEWIGLADGATVPTGTTVDARAGAITLTAAVDATGTQQSAEFSGAEFVVSQAHAGAPVTRIRLNGGDFSACPKRKSMLVRPLGAYAAKAKRPVRSLFGSGHGRFRTQGRFAAATVRGTIWQTDDYCDRTVITVKRGLVAVRDLHTGRMVEVPAGHSRTIRRR
jgi:hypothetical protein